MKKGKLTMVITIGIMSFTLMVTMFAQFRTIKETDITSIKTMREEELREQISIWKTKYEEANLKLEEANTQINEYKEKSLNNQEAKELVDKELAKVNLDLGKTDVEGQGIEVIIKDSKSIVTYEDLLKLVNELKLAEAEAISINDERIINLTDIVSANDYILVNGQRLSSPFVVKAIGNRKYLESGLTAKNGYIDKMQEVGKEVIITSEKQIKISKYKGEIKLKQLNEK